MIVYAIFFFFFEPTIFLSAFHYYGLAQLNPKGVRLKNNFSILRDADRENV
jgi:hypothetical protein